MRISDWSSDVCSSDLNHAGCAVKACQTAHDGQVVGIHAVAMQFLEIGKDFTHVIKRVGPLRMARHQRCLPGRKLGINAFGKRSEERRVGKECVSTCRSRWARYH